MHYKSLMIGCLMGIFFSACTPSDTAIQQTVNEKLSVIPGIAAAVKEGHVTLSGTVIDEVAKTAAEEALRGVKGVTAVTNNIQVLSETPPQVTVADNPDIILKHTLDSAFTAAGWQDISITVVNGEVTLEGTARKKQLHSILQAAQQPQTRKINNKLKLK
ncbi:BON domain-containing protein [Chitinophaga nivalis]|uniref:BON domain-containing protein n=1 Tax=Chitinophaga nivalis TaxID=2991709 RepID=A0ABT3IW30_9BACT|nr:BON domain-containing protein [Chitinophaga nivalis]MCW3462202.1 BON domain-containing protein [Chitinophaga nivalis]MCW3488106.1 BON domain-containing protein [Chitinophaga nivalis]